MPHFRQGARGLPVQEGQAVTAIERTLDPPSDAVRQFSRPGDGVRHLEGVFNCRGARKQIIVCRRNGYLFQPCDRAQKNTAMMLKLLCRDGPFEGT
jgi:hypothetical protein